MRHANTNVASPAAGAQSAELPGPCRKIVVVLGPTASGKTRIGVHLARAFGGEIVSADSRQVYCGLDIGTGKDLEEYGTGPEAVRRHLIDIVDPDSEYHLFRFLGDAHEALRRICCRGRLPIIVGGSGLYLHALLTGYTLDGGPPAPALRRRLQAAPDSELLDIVREHAPDLLSRVDRSQRRRVLRAAEIALTRTGPPASRFPAILDRSLVLGPFHPRKILHQRIEKRLDARLRAGLLQEVEQLHRNGLSWERLERFGLEYKWTSLLLRGKLEFPEYRERLLAGIRKLCKHQDIWFRKMEREGICIHWLQGAASEQAADWVGRFLRNDPVPPPQIRISEIHYDSRGNPYFAHDKT